MSVKRLAPFVAAAVLAAVPLAGAAAEAPATADQRFVAGLKNARQAGQVAFKQLTPWNISIDKINKAKAELSRVLDQLKKASQAAPAAVGASDGTIAASVSLATKLSAQAATQVRKGDYDRARKSIEQALKASQAALATFGVPLASEFKVIGGYRELANIEGWEEYLGLTAKAPGTSISKIVIGLAGRETANASEPGGRRAAPSLPIEKIAIYTLQEPSGVYTSGWGKIVNGIVVCDLKPTMDKDETFAISFGPRVAKGTKFLVKLLSTDGRRSYVVVTTK